MKKNVVYANQIHRLNNMLGKTLEIIDESMYNMDVRDLFDLADDLCAEIEYRINTSPYSIEEDDYLSDMYREYRMLVQELENLRNK